MRKGKFYFPFLHYSTDNAHTLPITHTDECLNLLNNCFSSHIRAKNFWNYNCTIFLLVVLKIAATVRPIARPIHLMYEHVLVFHLVHGENGYLHVSLGKLQNYYKKKFHDMCHSLESILQYRISSLL